MTTTAWVDSYITITANNIMVSTEEKGDPVPPEEIKTVFNTIKEMGLKSGSTAMPWSPALMGECGWSTRPYPGQQRP
jgi:hypothetical protein